MKSDVEQAVAELCLRFGDAEVLAHGTDDGGATVTINPINLGLGYSPKTTWMKFAISFQYPYADIYPLFVHPDLVRTDGKPHGEGISLASFQGEPALQVSRRSNHLNPEIDTAALKVTKVIEWLRTR